MTTNEYLLRAIDVVEQKLQHEAARGVRKRAATTGAAGTQATQSAVSGDDATVAQQRWQANVESELWQVTDARRAFIAQPPELETDTAPDAHDDETHAEN